MFKYTLEDYVQSNVTVDDLISEEGLKEIGKDLIAKLKVWIRKLRIWISSLFNKKEDIKNTPANVLKEAAKNVESPVKDENISEDEVWQPRGHHHLVQGIKAYLSKRAHGESIDDYTKNQYEEFVDKLKHPNLVKVPLIGLKDWRKYVSSELESMTKDVDEIANMFRYIDLGDYPDCKDGIVAAQRMLMVYIRILKYYDEIIANTKTYSDQGIVNRLPSNFKNLFSDVDSDKFVLDAQSVNRVFIVKLGGDEEKMHRVCLSLVSKSSGALIVAANKGDRYDDRFMRTREEVPDDMIVKTVRLCGLKRASTNEVLLKAIVGFQEKFLSDKDIVDRLPSNLKSLFPSDFNEFTHDLLFNGILLDKYDGDNKPFDKLLALIISLSRGKYIAAAKVGDQFDTNKMHHSSELHDDMIVRTVFRRGLVRVSDEVVIVTAEVV